MKISICILLAAAVSLSAFSCRTVKFDDIPQSEPEEKPAGCTTQEDELRAQAFDSELQKVEQEEKVVDVPKTVVYVDKPVYYPADEPAPAKKQGADAVSASTDSALKKPELYKGGVIWYDYNETFVYELYCQPYRITDLALEPGELVIEMPIMSEDTVWDVGAYVARKSSQDVQHLCFKPSYSGLVTSLIITTDRRTYHFLLKSFKDCYMTMVQFRYPNILPFNVKSPDSAAGVNSLSKSLVGVDPANISMDYKMTYSFFKKPYWLPKLVYDDGRRTYIKMDPVVLNMETPVLFNNSNELINYRVDSDLIVIDQLIEKVTMKRGGEKVTIKKRNYKPSKDHSDSAASDAAPAEAGSSKAKLISSDDMKKEKARRLAEEERLAEIQRTKAETAAANAAAKASEAEANSYSSSSK